MNKIGFYIFYFIVKTLSYLPFRVLFIFSDILYFLVFYVLKYRRKVVIENLKNSFPAKSEKELNQIEKKYFHHMCDMIFENIKLLSISESKMKQHFIMKNPELINNLYEQNKDIASIVAHYGNWEYGLITPKFFKHKILTIYKPISNKDFNNFYFNLRSRFTLIPVAMKETLKKILEHKQRNERIITFFIGDQTPHKDEIQYSTNFLNQNTPVFLGIEKISKKFNHTILFGKVDKVKRGTYSLEFIEFPKEAKDADDYEITKWHLKLLEEIINLRPELWLWSHRRWKYANKVDSNE